MTRGKAEKRWTERALDGGCILCGAPAEAHHPRTFAGTGQRAPDWFVIPLCQDHHRHGSADVSVHGQPETFRAIFGSEVHLLARTIERIARRLP